MNNKISKLLITSLTILTVTLIATYLKTQIDTYYKGRSMIKNVFLGMFVIVIIYYPMTSLLNKYFQFVSKKIVSKSKKISKSSTIGMLIGFSIAIFVLFLGYAKIWYNWNVVKYLLDKLI